jgi:hypothetical protein
MRATSMRRVSDTRSAWKKRGIPQNLTRFGPCAVRCGAQFGARTDPAHRASSGSGRYLQNQYSPAVFITKRLENIPTFRQLTALTARQLKYLFAKPVPT